MPDKIVNHFVLADGSTAKYDAGSLAGFIPELLKEATLPTPENAWIRYSNGEKVASNATNLFIFTGNLPTYIKAFLASDTNVLCAIAFYNSETIGTASYMASDSVDFATGAHNDGAWYETSVPTGCQAIAITTKKPSSTVADYQILFNSDYSIQKEVDAINNDVVADEENAETLIFEKTLTTASAYTGTLSRGLYRIETNIIGDETGRHIELQISGTDFLYKYIIYKNEPVKYLFIPSEVTYTYLYCRPSFESDTFKLYQINTSDSIADTLQAVPVKAGTLPIGTVTTGTWADGGKAQYDGRLAVGLYKCSGLFTVSLSDYSTYKYAVVIYKDDGTVRMSDSGWKTANYTFYCGNTDTFGITLSYVGSGALTPSDIDAIGLSITSDAYIDKTDEILERELSTLKNTVDGLDLDGIAENKTRSNLAVFTGRFKPCYDHLFVSKTGDDVVVPHESLYHVRLSRRLGYNTIEANVYPTSDGKYIVNHLNGGKFGGYFHHVDGETDISNIDASTVTWAWIEENVRYNSTIPKYRTRPCLLEEFLGECKQQNIIPFLGRANDAAVVAIANEIMGKDNYIAYGGNRTLSPSAPIYHWVTRTTKADILAYCDSIGAPFIYGMANPTAFTDEELADIVGTLHEHGYYIGVSYADYKWYKYQTLGFDFNGTQALANRIDVGNLYNINSIFSFDGFVYSSATEADGVLTFETAGTIVPNIPDTTYELCGIDIEVWFNGQIELRGIGDIVATDYNSDGTSPFYMSIPIVNGSPKFIIIAKANTTVYDIKFKASVF